jgi:hypothetical protein
MTYKDLTLHQKISLKGYFETNPGLANYRAAMFFFGFVQAINFFLSEDINCLKL